VVHDVVIGFNRAFGWVDGGKVDAVSVVAMDQIVMYVNVKLVKACGVTRAASGIAKR